MRQVEFTFVLPYRKHEIYIGANRKVLQRLERQFVGFLLQGMQPGFPILVVLFTCPQYD